MAASCSSVTHAQEVPPGFDANYVAYGIWYATTMAFIGPSEFLILKFTGQVKHVTYDGHRFTSETVLALDVDSDAGLLGIALAPDFPESGHVYLYYANDDPSENRLERYTWDGAQLADPVLITTVPELSGHDGGIIAFGPDNKLYAVIGDQGPDGMTENVNNGLVAEHAVILRLNPDGSVPNDNPLDTPGWGRFFGYGVRNSFGMAFDPLTGYLWNTENGPELYDEVNRVVPGYNSGWLPIMGPDSRDPQDIDDLVMIDNAVYVDPAFSWYDTIAPTSICFIDSCRFPPSLRHDCFVGAYGGGFFHFDLNEDRTEFVLDGDLADKVLDEGDDASVVLWGGPPGPVTDMEIGPDGYLYVATHNGYVMQVRPQFPMGDIDRSGTVGPEDRELFVNLLLTRAEQPDPPADEIVQGDFDGNAVVDGDDMQCFTVSLFMPD